SLYISSVLRAARPSLFPYTTLFRSTAARGRRPGRQPRTADPDRARRPGIRRDRAVARHHDAADGDQPGFLLGRFRLQGNPPADRSEEHTSELQSRENLVCRLLLEKK